ncbi:extracellular solute-binding protein [Orenia marismortui]|uniref:Iron(III) transport system substrate-binding protein n=1 Tax=Orenia marismortui TaxID=46469 RepID=A0A4R8GXX9_9FIRM|nr:extracellular solute-binding protein [Orenia marismortui]TDX51155.1 iron(III) transport system substrate-binding protein [Orenia marismortui]
MMNFKHYLTLAILFILTFSMIGCSNNPVSNNQNSNEVVIYTSLDQIYSEPIIKEFEEKTGIKVKAVYDTEATKTVGLVNRLIAEKNNPQADVFWNSEVGRTIVLKNKGILTPYQSDNAKSIPEYFKDKAGYWTGFATRSRVLIYNTNLIDESEVPTTHQEILDPKWKGKVVMADPLFGSTATEFAAFFSSLGAEKTKSYARKLKENGVVLVDGNSVVRDKVGAGEYPIGFTDTDDANSGIENGLPIKMFFLNQEEGQRGTFVMPNTVAMIKNGPNPANARKLMDYLLSPEVELKLAKGPSMQIPLHQGIESEGTLSIDDIKAMPVDFEAIGNKLEQSSRFLQELFHQ